jgi:hypothetical protein
MNQYQQNKTITRLAETIGEYGGWSEMILTNNYVKFTMPYFSLKVLPLEIIYMAHGRIIEPRNMTYIERTLCEVIQKILNEGEAL